jgi:hypothetical protein
MLTCYQVSTGRRDATTHRQAYLKAALLVDYTSCNLLLLVLHGLVHLLLLVHMQQLMLVLLLLLPWLPRPCCWHCPCSCCCLLHHIWCHCCLLQPCCGCGAIHVTLESGGLLPHVLSVHHVLAHKMYKAVEGHGVGVCMRGMH